MTTLSNFVYVLDENTNTQSPTFQRAIEFAKLNQADLTLLKVLPPVPSKLFATLSGNKEAGLQQKILDRENANLQNLVAKLDPALHASAEVRFGKQYVETIRAVQSRQYDLVIKAAEEIDWLDRWFGSDDMNLLRGCPCPVWLVKNHKRSEQKQIMAAVDFDDELESSNAELNPIILSLASALALADLATLHVVNVYDVPEAGFVGLWADQPDKIENEMIAAKHQERLSGMHKLMDSLKQSLGAESFAYLSPQTRVIKGIAAQELPKIAEEIQTDLVVMGTIARTGIPGVIIGNTAETVLSQLHCSVLAIKPPGFVSPIT